MINHTWVILQKFLTMLKYVEIQKLSVGIAMPVEILKLGTIDLENDELTKILNTMMNILLDNLKYKESNKIKFKL